MKSVLISINPKWCELIASGAKTVEVRKTSSKIETPFKCYIYCTAIKDHKRYTDEFDIPLDTGRWCGNGKVIGEFVCSEIDTYVYDCCDGVDIDEDTLLKAMLEWEEINIYAKGKVLYGWHISNLKIYDKPKELGEFRKCNALSIIDDLFINGCDNKNCKYAIKNTDIVGDDGSCSYDNCPKLRIERPPQSWCYVEELE